jgi:hypothetical protein
VREELPDLDRPVRFTVTRGARGSVKADSLDELADALDRPYADEEMHRAGAVSAPLAARGPNPSRDRRGGRSDRGGPPHPHGKKGGHDKGSHRPGSPSGRGKRRGKGR